MTNKTRKWIRSGLETFIHGGTSAIIATTSVSIIDPKDWGASWKTLHLAGLCFLASGGMRFMQWWNANPLPEIDTAPPIGAPTVPQISLNPLAKVQPITPQPPVEPPKQ